MFQNGLQAKSGCVMCFWSYCSTLGIESKNKEAYARYSVSNLGYLMGVGKLFYSCQEVFGYPIIFVFIFKKLGKLGYPTKKRL